MEFPQFRKYKNGHSYFMIKSATEFIEYRLQFKRVEEHHFIAKILPDRNFIADMLYDYHEYWEKVSEEELLAFLSANSQ